MAASAGLLHDLAKELPARQKEELALSYFDRHGQRPSSDFLKGELAHGPASAIMASRLTGMENDPLVHAIAWHSTGHPDMTVLGGILFLADKIAYDREFGELREIRALAESGNLAGAMKACFEEVFKALARQGKSPCELSIQAYKKYSEMG